MMTELEFIIATLAGGFAVASPLVIAGMGELFSQRAGVLNVGIEGFLLTGALAGLWAAYISGNMFVGMLGGVVAGAALASIQLVLCIYWRAPQMLAGIGINVLSLGLTSLWFSAMTAAYGPMFVQVALPLRIPVLSNIPVIGAVLFEQNIYFYLAIGLVLFFSIFLYRTSFGLKVRSVGENPLAAETVGVNVFKTRGIAQLLSGALGGLGGSFLTLGYAGAFSENMSLGRGYVVLAIIIAGGWDPLKILAVALIFGVAEDLTTRLQFVSRIPYPFLFIVPYALTITILIIRRRKAGPAMLAIPYVKKR